MEIIGIQAKDFPDVAGLTAWHFESLADRSYGEENVEHLMSEVMNETRQCWIAWDGKVKACGLTQVLNHGIKVVEFTKQFLIGISSKMTYSDVFISDKNKKPDLD